ncbi:hypothetical protein OC844_005269, partial [Tilletia horrida]
MLAAALIILASAISTAKALVLLPPSPIGRLQPLGHPSKCVTASFLDSPPPDAQTGLDGLPEEIDYEWTDEVEGNAHLVKLVRTKTGLTRSP